MAVPATRGPFAGVTTSNDPGGWPDGTTWVNLRLVSSARAATAERSIVVVDGIEHQVNHTLAELATAMEAIT